MRRKNVYVTINLEGRDPLTLTFGGLDTDEDAIKSMKVFYDKVITDWKANEVICNCTQFGVAFPFYRLISIVKYVEEPK